MPPITFYTKWNERPSDFEDKINPLKKFFFICEGANTESFYFKKLIDIKKQVGIHSSIDLILIEKTGEDRNLSYPKKLVDFAKEKRNYLIKEGLFDSEQDVMIVTFDLDIFKKKVSHLTSLLDEQDDHLWFGLTYPAFELFLLLHIENSVHELIYPNYDKIMNNEKIGNQRPCQYYLREVTNMNSKTNASIGDLATDIEIAIKQEKEINQKLEKCLTCITSNIASIIEKIQKEKLPFDI